MNYACNMFFKEPGSADFYLPLISSVEEKKKAQTATLT